jgi:hypothetical protein
MVLQRATKHEVGRREDGSACLVLALERGILSRTEQTVFSGLSQPVSFIELCYRSSFVGCVMKDLKSFLS